MQITEASCLRADAGAGAADRRLDKEFIGYYQEWDKKVIGLGEWMFSDKCGIFYRLVAEQVALFRCRSHKRF